MINFSKEMFQRIFFLKTHEKLLVILTCKSFVGLAPAPRRFALADATQHMCALPNRYFFLTASTVAKDLVQPARQNLRLGSFLSKKSEKLL